MTPLRVTDDQMMRAVASLSGVDFGVVEVRDEGDQHMLVRFWITDEPGTFGVRLPLPSRVALKPWLDSIPESAADAAGMLADFIEEEAATGCAQWGRTTVRGDDLIFELAPYGFRRDDDVEHARLLDGAGPGGYWGPLQENDDTTDTRSGRGRARRGRQTLTYSEVGATSGTLPDGYRRVEVTRAIGDGPERFEVAARRLLSWEMHRRAGLLVHADRPPTAQRDAVLELRLGPFPVTAPVRVIEVIREPMVAGFSYGTLPGHPEIGEERFLVRLGKDGAVTAEIRAFSRPGRWFTRLGAPIARHLQDAVTRRYLNALAARDPD